MKTVLFIEDNQQIRENVGEILELADYRVLLAADGKQGAAMALAEVPDIVVCDIMMPELDGYGVIHLLQKHKETRHIPFIFLTAKTERAEMRRGMELGADDYIAKPFSATELLSAIESRLRKSEEMRSAISEDFKSLAALVDKSGSKDLKQAFAEGQEIRDYQKKQPIYTAGHRAYRLYHVLSGKVKIYKTNDEGKDLILGICHSGEFFGYTTLLEEGVYKETAEALEPCEIASITKEAFEELMSNNRDLMKQFIRMLAGNVREKEEQLLGIAYNSLRKKVADSLMTLHRKYATEEGGVISAIRISRDNLAAVAGTAKESLIRTLGDFRDEGLIDIQDAGIVILQEKKLEKMCN